MTPDHPDSYVLTVDEVAHRLQVSTRTVRRLIASGQLRVVKIRRRTFILPREVDAFLAAAARHAA